jgi:hypothetical protein
VTGPAFCRLWDRAGLTVDAVEGSGPDLVVAFASVGQDAARPPAPEFVATATGRGTAAFPRRALFVGDAARSWASHPGFAPALQAAVDQLRARAPVARIATVGLSMGAYAALAAMQVLPVDVALAFGPQTAAGCCGLRLRRGRSGGGPETGSANENGAAGCPAAPFFSSAAQGLRDYSSASPPRARPDGAAMLATAKLRLPWSGLTPAGSVDIVDVDHIADLAAGQVNGDVIGNVTGGDFQFHFVTHDGQGAAALQAGRFVVVHELDVDEQLMRDSSWMRMKVDVGRQVLDHVALHAAADHMHVILAFNLQVEQRLQEAALLQALQQVVVVDVDRRPALCRRHKRCRVRCPHDELDERPPCLSPSAPRR